MEFLSSLKDISYALLTIIILLTESKCDDNHNGVDEHNNEYTNVPISTPEDIQINSIKDITKLSPLLTDNDDREEGNKALDSISQEYSERFDDEIEPRIHIHHIFPPALIRPLQRVVIRKMIEYINKDPIRRIKRKMKKEAIKATVVAGVVGGIPILAEVKKELNQHKLLAKYHVSGVVDLSGKKKNRNDYESDAEDKPKDYKDYKLLPDNPHVWPFNEDKHHIYEKWNKFPHETDAHLIPHKVKLVHKSFHELHPELLHLVHDINGLIEKEKVVYSKTPEIESSVHSHIESPLVLFGQLLKLADSLIPSIRIRIPFVEYLIKSFHQKTKPKVVYVKQPPKIHYIPVPYKEDEQTYDTNEPQLNVKYVETGSGITDKQSNNPNVQYVNHNHNQQFERLNTQSNYEQTSQLPIYRQKLVYPTIDRPRPDYDSRPPPPRPQYFSKMLEKAEKLYKDRKKA